MRTLARVLGIAAAAISVAELWLFFRGIPQAIATVLESVPPTTAILLLYLPGPIVGLAAFAVWANLDDHDRRQERWVPYAAVSTMVVPILPGLLLVLSGLVAGLMGR